MIGDSAGLVDPITGEGLYYALRSAELCANALLAGRPDDYRVLAGRRVACRVEAGGASFRSASTADRFSATAFWSGWFL